MSVPQVGNTDAQFEVEGSSSAPVRSLSPAQLEVQAPDDGLKASVLDLKTPPKKCFCSLRLCVI